MATRFGLTGAWNSTGTWSTSSGGSSGASVPVAGDDVILDSNSGAINITAAAVCRSLDCTAGTGNYTGTLTQSPSIGLSIGTTTVNASNVALKLWSGMTYILGSNCLISFVSTSATQITITTNTIVIPNPNFNGAGGSWKNLDAMTVAGTITMSSGTWNTNNQAISANAVSFGATVVRTLTLGSSVFSLFASTGALTGNTGNLTITPNTATFVMSPSGSSGTPWNPAVSTDYKGASVVVVLPTGSNYTLAPGASTVANLVVTNGNFKTCVLSLASNPIVTGGIAFQGFSTTSRLMVVSSVFGTQRTITNTGASAVNQITLGGTNYQTQYCDIQDLKLSTVADLSGNIQPANTSPILSGDAGGNTNITFTGTQDQYFGSAQLTGSTLQLGGLSGSYASTPNASWNQITGDIDMRIKLSLANWVPGSTQCLISKWTAVSNQFAYDWTIASSGALQLNYSPDGSAIRTATSSATTGFSANTTNWLRVTYAAASGQTIFYTSSDGSTWTQLGTTQTITSGSIFASSADVEVGATTSGTSALLAANVYVAQILSGIGGTTQFNANFAGQSQGITSFTESSTNASTVTVNNSGNVNYSNILIWTARVPLPQDNVHINNGTSTLTFDMPRYGGNIDFTGFTGTASFSSITGYAQSQAFGNWTFSTGMAVAGTATISLQGRGAQTIQNNGQHWPSSCVPAGAGTGTYTLLDAMQCGSTGNSNCNPTSGSFNTAGFNVTCSQFFFNNAVGGGTLTITNSAITCNLSTATATFFSVAASTVAVNATGSTIILAKAVTTFNRTFIGSGFTYGTLQYTVASSPGQLIVTGNNTFSQILINNGPSVLVLPANGTTTVTKWNVKGQQTSGYVYFGGANGLTGGSYVTTGDAAFFDIAGDIDLICYAAADATNVVGGLITKSNTINVSYQMLYNSNAIELRLSADGTTLVSLNSANTGSIAGQATWYRATWSQSTTTATFYTSTVVNPGPNDWTTISSGTLSVASIANTAAQMVIGNDLLNGHGFQGKIYRSQVFNGIGGTKVSDVDFTGTQTGTETTYSDTGTSGASWTVNGPINGLIYVTSSSAGTQSTMTSINEQVSNYLSLKDSNVDSVPVWYAGTNSNNVSNNTNWIFSTPIFTMAVLGTLSVSGVAQAIFPNSALATLTTLLVNPTVQAILGLTTFAALVTLTIIAKILDPYNLESSNVVLQGQNVSVPMQSKNVSVGL